MCTPDSNQKPRVKRAPSSLATEQHTRNLRTCLAPRPTQVPTYQAAEAETMLGDPSGELSRTLCLVVAADNYDAFGCRYLGSIWLLNSVATRFNQKHHTSVKEFQGKSVFRLPQGLYVDVHALFRGNLDYNSSCSDPQVRWFITIFLDG